MTVCSTCEHDPCLADQSKIPGGERCVLNHIRQSCRPRRTAPGLYVCYGHRKGMARNLIELPDMHSRLAERHLKASAGLVETRGGGEVGLTVKARVANVRGDVYTELAGWARVAHDERGFTLPADDVASIARFLLGRRAANLDWFCAHPAVDEFNDTLEHLHREAFSVLYPRGRRRFEAGACIEVIACDVVTHAELRCQGRMLATITDQDDMLPSNLWCDECGIEITADRWLTYGRRVQRAMQAQRMEAAAS